MLFVRRHVPPRRMATSRAAASIPRRAVTTPGRATPKKRPGGYGGDRKSFDIHTLRFCAMLEAKAAGSEKQKVAAVVDFLEGIISLFIAGDPRLRVPVWMCPGGGGPVVQLYYSNQGQNMTLNGLPDPTKVFVLDPPVTIPPDTSFKVMLDYAAAPALWSGAYPFMWMVLGGREY